MRSRVAFLPAVLLALGGAAALGPPVARAADTGPWLFNPATGHEYQEVRGLTWPEAEAYAQSVNGHLVTINDAAEQAWLEAAFPAENLWIGLTDAAVEGTWVWASGEPVTYTNWCPGQPDDWPEVGGEDYALMNAAYCGGQGWDDADGAPFNGIVEVARVSLEVSTSLKLAADVTGTITIAADGLTLDCAGHRLTGSGEDTGIMLDGRTGVTVKNCRVSGFVNGIRVVNWAGPSSRNTLTGNTVTDSGSAGFVVIGSSADVLAGNVSDDTAYGDYLLIDSTMETVSSNTATHGGWYGIVLQGSSSNTLRGNHAHQNGTNGGGDAILLTEQSNANLLVANDASDNRPDGSGVDGIRIDNSQDNIVRGNAANGNATWGFIVVGGSGNTLAGNVARANAIIGFALNATVGNRLSGNTASANGESGFNLCCGANANTLERNAATANKGDGFVVGEGAGNRLVANTASGNGDGTHGGNAFALLGATGAVLTQNSAQNSPWACFGLYGAQGASLTGNTASGCSAGFDLGDGASGNTLRGNIASNNGYRGGLGNGFRLERASSNTLASNIANANNDGFNLSSGASSNTITGNTANGNTDYGFVVWIGTDPVPPQDNAFTRNSAHGNATLDAFEDGSSTGDIWTGNNFGTHDGF